MTDLTATLFPGGAPADLSDWLIVAPASAAAQLVAWQDAIGATRHRATPVPLSDGRFVLPANLLSETAPGGLHERWSEGPAAALAAACTVARRADVADLLPVVADV